MDLQAGFVCRFRLLLYTGAHFAVGIFLSRSFFIQLQVNASLWIILYYGHNTKKVAFSNYEWKGLSFVRLSVWTQVFANLSLLRNQKNNPDFFLCFLSSKLSHCVCASVRKVLLLTLYVFSISSWNGRNLTRTYYTYTGFLKYISKRKSTQVMLIDHRHLNTLTDNRKKRNTNMLLTLEDFFWPEQFLQYN